MCIQILLTGIVDLDNNFVSRTDVVLFQGWREGRGGVKKTVGWHIEEGGGVEHTVCDKSNVRVSFPSVHLCVIIWMIWG